MQIAWFSKQPKQDDTEQDSYKQVFDQQTNYDSFSFPCSRCGIGSSIGQMDRSILFIYANRFKGIETGF